MEKLVDLYNKKKQTTTRVHEKAALHLAQKFPKEFAVISLPAYQTVLSDEDIIKVFGLYVGSEHKGKNSDKQTWILQANLQQVIYSPRSYTLILDRIEDMPDEHAIAIAAMLYPNHSLGDCVVSREYNRIDVHLANYTAKIYYNGSIKGEQDGWVSYHVVDQLREWGYMVPYKGVDLFDAEVAIPRVSKDEGDVWEEVRLKAKNLLSDKTHLSPSDIVTDTIEFLKQNYNPLTKKQEDKQ